MGFSRGGGVSRGISGGFSRRLSRGSVERPVRDLKGCKRSVIGQLSKTKGQCFIETHF